MGDYSELHIGKNFIGSEFDIDYGLLQLFLPSDLQIEKVKKDDVRLKHRYCLDYLEEDEDLIYTFQYIRKSSEILDRLEIMGITLELAKKDFDLFQKRNQRSSLIGSLTFSKNNQDKLIKILENLTVNEWMQSLKVILQQQSKPCDIDPDIETNEAILQNYMSKTEWYGYPGHHHGLFLRLFLEVCDTEEDIIFDLTDLLHSGNWASGEIKDLEENIHVRMMQIFSERFPIIVITEGKSDGWVLERSLKLLYPHLNEYYRFLDFEESNLGGGASELAKIVKAFSGSGIINRIIALFDNDTAGELAIKSLETTNIPDNIYVTQYPSIDIATNYPTLGPTGLANMNVNGLAGSIEIYFGIDVLMDDNGLLSPIQWTGYKSELNQYQGEIINKRKMKSRFNKKLKLCEREESLIPEYDWTGIKSIIDSMQVVFHDIDYKEHFELMKMIYS